MATASTTTQRSCAPISTSTAPSLSLQDGEIVGGSHSHLLEMSVPGGVATVAGVSNVEVQPTHTRRGIMTRMMRYQLDGIHERGEPLAALFATESAIYGRFGYGVGSVHEWWTIDKHHTAYARKLRELGPNRLLGPRRDIGKELPDVFRRGTHGRPAVFQRAPHHWERDARDPIHSQGGPGGVFYAAYVEDGRIDGYVNYRTQRPAVIVNELMAATREASAALWRFCFDLDLHERTEAIKRPVDDPMPWMLADPRRLQRSTRDGLWVRIVDVAAALELRQYLANDHLTLQVRDDFCSWNDRCFELDGSLEGATCRPDCRLTRCQHNRCWPGLRLSGRRVVHHPGPRWTRRTNTPRVRLHPRRSHVCRPPQTLDSLQLLRRVQKSPFRSREKFMLVVETGTLPIRRSCQFPCASAHRRFVAQHPVDSELVGAHAEVCAPEHVLRDHGDVAVRRQAGEQPVRLLPAFRGNADRVVVSQRQAGARTPTLNRSPSAPNRQFAAKRA